MPGSIFRFEYLLCAEKRAMSAVPEPRPEPLPEVVVPVMPQAVPPTVPQAVPQAIVQAVPRDDSSPTSDSASRESSPLSEATKSSWIKFDDDASAVATLEPSQSVQMEVPSPIKLEAPLRKGEC